MNFINYTNEMKELGTPVALVGAGLLALFLVIIILKMLGGMRRGTWRQLVRTGFTLLAAVVSYIAGGWLSNHIIGSFNVESVVDLLDVAEAYAPGSAEAVGNLLSQIDTALVEYLLLLPATILIIPLVTAILFICINIVLKVVRAIIIRVIHIKKAKNNTQRLGGALLAAVEVLIWLTMVMFPVSAVLSLVDHAYEQVIEESSMAENEQVASVFEEYINPFTKNPALSLIDDLGAGAMADGIATVRIDNEKTNMREEILSIANVILVDGTSLSGADFTNLDQDSKAALTSIINALADSPFISRILVSTLKTIPAIYESGLIPLDLGDSYDTVIDSLMTFLNSITREGLKDDLNTLKNFYFGFNDSGLLAAIKNNEDLMKFVTDDYKGDKHVLNMLNTLSGNPRTKNIVDGLYNLVLNMAFSGAMNDATAGENGEGSLPAVNITEVKESLNEIISIKKENYETVEEYREELANTIDQKLNDTIGVDLEKEVVDEVATYVDENFSEKLDNLTDEEFNELMFEMIDIYQGYQNGEDINPDDFDDILGGDTDLGDLGDLGDLLGGGGTSDNSSDNN